MAQYASINRKKVKAVTSVRNLLKEMERTNGEDWDDGSRIIHPEKTAENIILVDFRDSDFFDDAADIDTARHQLVNQMNEGRAARSDKTKATRAQSRALRSDTVDVITSVVQPSPEFINSKSRAEQIKFFEDALQVLDEDKATWGQTLAAVVHFDENTPHMQVVSSTLNFDTLTADAKRMMGNKTKMSNDQTKFVESLQAKGWEIERGIKRVDNPDYQNWADEKRKDKVAVNRYTDRQLLIADAEASLIEKQAETTAFQITEAAESEATVILNQADTYANTVTQTATRTAAALKETTDKEIDAQRAETQAAEINWRENATNFIRWIMPKHRLDPEKTPQEAPEEIQTDNGWQQHFRQPMADIQQYLLESWQALQKWVNQLIEREKAVKEKEADQLVKDIAQNDRESALNKLDLSLQADEKKIQQQSEKLAQKENLVTTGLEQLANTLEQLDEDFDRDKFLNDQLTQEKKTLGQLQEIPLPRDEYIKQVFETTNDEIGAFEDEKEQFDSEKSTWENQRTYQLLVELGALDTLAQYANVFKKEDPDLDKYDGEYGKLEIAEYLLQDRIEDGYLELPGKDNLGSQVSLSESIHAHYKAANAETRHLIDQQRQQELNNYYPRQDHGPSR